MKATEEKQLQIFGPDRIASPASPEVRSPKTRKSLAAGERLLADTAAVMNAASPESFGRALESVLQAVTAGYGAGRGAIFEAAQGEAAWRLRREWRSPAFRPGSGADGDWPPADLRRAAENLTVAELLTVGAGQGRAARAVLITPLSGGGQRIGFLGLEAPAGESPWGGSHLERLGALAHIIADAWARVRAEGERCLFRTAVETAGELIAVTDRDGSIEYVNPAFEKITGYTRAEIIGQNPRILKSGRQNRAFYREMWKILTRGEAWHGFFVNRKKDGGLYTEEATITPLKDGTGRISHYVAVKRDMTQETSLERQLIQSQKMEAIGTLAGGIAHDFNNILSAIMGYAELALYEVSDRDRSRHDIEEVIKAGNRARDLVKQILTFSRKTEQELKPLNINPLLKEALKFLRASLPSTIEIQADIKSQAANVLCNPTQIQQVVMNLCTNAAQAMKDTGGRLAVSTIDADLTQPDAERHAELESAKYVRLTVSDTGPGIAPQIIGRIFDPYFTTKEQGEGTGLGLSVVHGIVKSLKGAIEVDNHPGEGVAFHIYLPQVSEPVKSEAQQTRLLPTGSERVLLVDDEDVLVEMGKLMLERLGYDVTVCTSGPDALETFSSRPNDFDLVFTDKTMPHLTGFDLAAEIKRVRPNIPVIITTGFSDEEEVRRAGELGIDRLAMKPLTMDDLASIVRSVLDSRKGAR